MKVETYLVLNRDEIHNQIPYSVVAETMGGARWNTGKRKRLMKQYFTETEIDAIYRMHKQAHSWYCVKGVPDELRITPHILALWHKLAAFCCEI
jgi:hypothetical protein